MAPESLSDQVRDNGFCNLQKTIAIGYMPENNPLFIPVVASTKINLFRLREVIDILFKIDCLDPVIQIRQDGNVVFRQTEENSVGLLVCPIEEEV